MRENRNAIYITACIAVVSLTMAAVITYCSTIQNLFLNADFAVNCLIGIFTGAFLSLIAAIINYRVERQRLLTVEVSFLSGLILEIIPIYYLFQGGYSNLEHETRIIDNIYQIMNAHIHLEPKELQFFCKKSKIEKQLDYIIDMLIELFAKIESSKRAIDRYEFQMIEEDELQDNLQELYIYLRDYKGQIFTNALGDERDKLSELAKLQFSHKLKTNF